MCSDSGSKRKTKPAKLRLLGPASQAVREFSSKPSAPEKGTEWWRGDGLRRRYNGKTWVRACARCPPSEKSTAKYKDEDGRRALCAACARVAGTYEVLNPCRDCPEGSKRRSRQPDEVGRANKLCATCARAAGCHEVEHPCRDCPEGAKLEAAFKDEDGRPKTLCATCARAAGSYKALPASHWKSGTKQAQPKVPAATALSHSAHLSHSPCSEKLSVRRSKLGFSTLNLLCLARVYERIFPCRAAG